MKSTRTHTDRQQVERQPADQQQPRDTQRADRADMWANWGPKR